MAQILNEKELKTRLLGLPGWKVDGSQLVRIFEFDAFMDGVEFVKEVGELAEDLNHHPEIDIRYKSVIFRLTTHDSDGVTQKDIDFASEMDDLLGG
ncbi:MAG: 4a-hydroxytetrahydrobiopterin dehydratase [Verrucomicrobiota bacterium]